MGFSAKSDGLIRKRDRLLRTNWMGFSAQMDWASPEELNGLLHKVGWAFWTNRHGCVSTPTR